MPLATEAIMEELLKLEMIGHARRNTYLTFLVTIDLKHNYPLRLAIGFDPMVFADVFGALLLPYL